MKFQYKNTQSVTALASDYLVLFLSSTVSVKTLSEIYGEDFANTLKALYRSGDFKGESRQTLALMTPPGLKAKRVLLVGLGDTKSLDTKTWNALMASVSAKILASPAQNCHIQLPSLLNTADLQRNALDTASQFYQHNYQYRRTLSEANAPKPAKLTTVTVLHADKSTKTALEAGLAIGQAQGEGLSLTRELGNLPANICTPSFLQQSAQALADTSEAIQLEVLEEADMQALNMGALLSVAAGSTEAAKLIILKYNGGEGAPVALVGKGVTFDTGGISIKPAPKMDEMKYDMCGAASVLGIFKALSVLQPAINVVGIIPTTENMPAGNATKPGDVVTSMSGKTIEVLNTDAEGRLILCDALTYAARFEPKAVIDIATLTGACIVALGHHRSGLYSNNDDLGTALFKAGTDAHDLAWQMPLDDVYTKQLKSRFADLGNIGSPGAGSVTAACFLSEFAKDYNWAHLDIAGTAWNSPGIKGASGRPVALLFNYLLNN